MGEKGASREVRQWRLKCFRVYSLWTHKALKGEFDTAVLTLSISPMSTSCCTHTKKKEGGGEVTKPTKGREIRSIALLRFTQTEQVT